MLMSVGKSSSIGEMLTINDAASDPPGERHVKLFASFVVSVQLGGTVHDMSCRSHFTSLPPAIAAVCASVGCAGSGFAALSLTEGADLVSELLFLNLSERLQSDKANPITNTSAMCFI